MLTNEAEDQAVDGLSNVKCTVVLDEECLQLVVIESFTSEFNVLMTDVCEHCGLRMHVVISASLCNNAALDVAEKNNAFNLGPKTFAENLLEHLWVEHLERGLTLGRLQLRLNLFLFFSHYFTNYSLLIIIMHLILLIVGKSGSLVFSRKMAD